MNKAEIQETQKTSFSVKVKKTLWYIFVVSAVVGFIYQSWSFIIIYLHYQTVVDVRVNAHDDLIFPAITVCNNNRMRRSAFCAMRPTSEPCVSNGTELYHKWAEDWHVQDFCKKGKIFWWLGHMHGNLIHSCQVEPNRIANEICDWKFSRLSDPKYYMCYTINGEWEIGAPKKPVTSRMILEDSVEMYFTLDVEPHEYLVYDRDLGARVVIHDPDVLPDPESEGIDLKAGTSYQIGIQQTSTIMLPPPYQTQCAHAQEITSKLNITYVKGMSRQVTFKDVLIVIIQFKKVL
ncbi:acid-sensing ion channel 4-like [Limulus polyphemus]|uniref:Acid-sensing ion channel 4-like n=1 Tax=Limulus polyphemus TaxID=6850 RepID=A0ABM1SGI2_LIMPO|nr:acid-sensing ion channel 4-like [Limulus polyphemus]